MMLIFSLLLCYLLEKLLCLIHAQLEGPLTFCVIAYAFYSLLFCFASSHLPCPTFVDLAMQQVTPILTDVRGKR